VVSFREDSLKIRAESAGNFVLVVKTAGQTRLGSVRRGNLAAKKRNQATYKTTKATEVALCVPRNGVEPLRPLRVTGFSYRYSFHCSCFIQDLWSGLYLRHILLNLGALRLVSTPSLYFQSLARDYQFT
jgi:hypothetical protein